jgi:hypothetical protein
MLKIRSIGLLLFISLLFLYCTSPKSNEDSDTVHKDHIDWIALKHSQDFNDLALFLEQHPSSKYFDSALVKFLNHINNSYDALPPWHCGSSCRDVILSEGNRIQFSGSVISVDSLASLTLHFLSDQTIPTREIEVDLALPLSISKAHLAVTYDSASVHLIQPVFIEIRKAVELHKQNLAAELNAKSLEVDSLLIDSLFNRRIVLFEMIPVPEPPPPAEGMDIIISESQASLLDYYPNRKISSVNVSEPEFAHFYDEGNKVPYEIWSQFELDYPYNMPVYAAGKVPIDSMNTLLISCLYYDYGLLSIASSYNHSKDEITYIFPLSWTFSDVETHQSSKSEITESHINLMVSTCVDSLDSNNPDTEVVSTTCRDTLIQLELKQIPLTSSIHNQNREILTGLFEF